ncbi:uncharacterized protein N7459_007667 [Penicillium hispanicum]|uniref:uncharacterized protein n=1 Tax=Penicillium hispanicum TaxID=1080232 RepID=UPI00254135BC|nr:uncharacterized protein N7459_007667 [Penicillium hispanicum]KAJ5578703.1 hypothetical protein N7459_007667 [Penicillium hispanicum]
MSTEQPHTPDRSVLGESWVVASTASIKYRDSKETPDPASPSPQPRSERKKDGDKTAAQPSDSLTSSSSSWTMSGPELIMPSIYEMPVSEASWVAPNLRSKNQTSNYTMKKRRKPSFTDEESRRAKRLSAAFNSPGAGSSTPTHQNAHSVVARLATFCRDQGTFFRTAINGLLIALILHLLVLPELIYQAQDLCQFPGMKALYADSCVPLKARPLHPSSAVVSPEETIITSQKHLETIFDSTLQTLLPLSQLLKESENMLSDLQDQLQASFPDVRNALDLEFQGSDQAIRAATWEFDSLRADLRSAVDSLLASPPTQDSSGSMARDTRFAAQLRRRAEYLDRLRAQIRTKADSLSSRFSTLDDHLEAVDSIVAREERRASLLSAAPDGHGRGAPGALQGVLHSLSRYAAFGGEFFARSRSAQDSSAPGPSVVGANARPATTLALLRLAATHHRPVADSVLRLSRQLRDVQRDRLGSTW